MNCHTQEPKIAVFGHFLKLWNERVVENKHQLFNEIMQSVKCLMESTLVLHMLKLNSPNVKLKLMKQIHKSNIGYCMQDPEFSLDDM